MELKIEREPRDVPVLGLNPWPKNPRKSMGDLESLTAAVREQGILQRLLVRDCLDGRGGLEIICGERRWRAAQAAGLETVPVDWTQDLDDDDNALAAAVAENMHREDVHPLEEADGIAAMRQRRTVEEIAARLGRSASYVYRRLALAELCGAARDALVADRLSLAGAELLARVTDPDLQAQIVDRLMQRSDGAIGVHDVRWASRDALLSLARATWALDDPKLVKLAGACTSCPKRTGAQAALFGEVEDDDRCTDPGCFADKREAEAARRLEIAKASGAKVLTIAELEKLYPHAHSASSAYEIERKGYADLDHQAAHGRKTWREILGDRAIAKHVAKDPHAGDVHELVKLADVKKLLKKDPRKGDPDLDPKPASGPSSSGSKKDAKRSKDEIVRDAKHDAVGAILDELAARIGAELSIEDGLRFLAESMLAFQLGDETRIARRVGLKVEGYSPDNMKKFVAAMAKAAPAQLLAACFEVALIEDFPLDTSAKKGDRSVAQRVLEHAGVDWLGIEQEAIELALAEPGKCRRCGCTETTPCADDNLGACAWVDEKKTLCTACEDRKPGEAPAKGKGKPKKKASAKKAKAPA